MQKLAFMKNIKYILLICVVLIGGFVNAQSQDELGQLMRNRGEYYFTLSVDDPTQIQTLGEICSIDGTDGRNVVAYANQQEYDKLIALGFQPELQTPPSLRANVTMWNGQGTYNWDSYLTYPQYVSMMEGFPAKAITGRNCTLIDLGQLSTSAHRHLLGVRINNGSPEGKPKFLYTSTMHGDEITGMILMLRLIDELCTSTDTRIVNLLNDLDIYIFPLTNPDGTYKGGNNTVNSAQRYNGNNIDLNRNYKDYYKGNHPDNNSYQEETVWTMAFGDENLFTMSANYHGGAEVMNYPWDAVYDDHADMDWYEHVCTEYVQVARQTYSSYMSDTYSDGVTNGATWYVITGSRQDYMNAYAQCREVTVECSSTKTPSANTLPSYWSYNHNSMLAFMEQARNGIHGVVRDAQTGQPIEGATVTVLNHDTETSFVTTHAVGDFHSPIKGGTWSIKITKEGYCPETISVTVADDQREDVDVYLFPEGSCPAAMECYEQTTPSAAGSYVMGYLNDSMLMMPTHNGSSTSTTTAVEVSPSDNGFSLGEEVLPGMYTLTAYGSNGQYYIKYNNRYLSRSNNTNITWGTSQSSSGRWYINANGIYVAVSSGWGGSTTNYYLYYDTSSNSFKLSTTNEDNITFYSPCVCPATIELGIGWNWWTPINTMTLSELETALGSNGVIINSQDGGFARYENNAWSGTLSAIVPGQMYRIKTCEAVSLTLTGTPATSGDIIIMPGYNWFGYTGSYRTSIAKALGSDFMPANGDQIIAEGEQSATYNSNTQSWEGDLFYITPGHGYVYHSNASQSKTITLE